MRDRPRTPRHRGLVTLVIASLGLVALGACSRSDDGSSGATTLLPSTTTSAISSDDAFDQALTDQLDGLSPAFIDGSRAAGHTLCSNLAALEAQPEGDATSSTDLPLGDLTQSTLVIAMLDGYSQPAVAAVILRAAGDHLCPDYADVIDQTVTDQGQ